MSLEGEQTIVVGRRFGRGRRRAVERPDPGGPRLEGATLADLEALDPEERARLNRLLTSLTEPSPPPPAARRRRVLVLTVSTVGSIVLFPWVVYLIFTLSERPQGGEWWLAWAGFDVALAAALGCTAIFGWLRREFVLVPLLVTGVLLCCDAWFDITLSWGTDESWLSFVTALLIELPLAALMLRAAHGVGTSTVHHVQRREGRDGSVPPLHTLPINLEVPLPDA